MIWWLGTAWAATLSGTVSNVEGQPVAGVYVAVYDEALSQVAVEGPTGVDGRWVAEVPAGMHRVRVVPGMSLNLVESWEPGDITDACQADVHPVDADGVELGADVTLAPGMAIAGVVRDDAGEAIAGATITAAPFAGGLPIQARQALSRSDGSFEVRGLLDDRAWLLDVEAEGLPDQYFPGVYSRLEAESFPGVAGRTTDVGEALLLPGIRVTGVLSGPDGPLVDVRVAAYSPNQIRTSRTDEDGRYDIVGLPPGEVTAWSTPEGHAKTYYPDSDRPSIRVSAPDEGDIAQVDIAAPYESILEGQLLGDGDLSVASVLLYNDARTVGFGSAVEVDGRFDIGSLHGGDWALQVQPSAAGYLPGFVGGDEDPTVIPVPPEGRAEVAVDLIPAVEISGVVRRADGEPAYAALVTATSRDTGTAWRTYTGRDGRYALQGLPGLDTYDLSAEGDPPCPNDPDRVRIYHPATPDPQAKVGLALVGGDVFSWDVQLPDDVDGDGMDDEWERRWGLDPEQPDGLADPDGDGNPNLVEYWVDDDPFRGRGACGGGGGAAFVFLLPLWLVRSRREP